MLHTFRNWTSRVADHVNTYLNENVPDLSSNIDASSLVYEDYVIEERAPEFAPSNTDLHSLLHVLIEEYKHVDEHLPSGMLVVPSFETLLEWHGVIFVREGVFKDAIFKFTMHVPADYPKNPPKIYFFSKVFHPLVNSENGLVDISPAFPSWRPGRDYLVLVLSFLKKLLVKEDLNTFSKTMIRSKFIQECHDCVAESLRMVYVCHPNSPIPFSAWTLRSGLIDPDLADIQDAFVKATETSGELARDEFVNFLINKGS